MSTPYFNIRVYGLLIQNEQILLTEEQVHGSVFIKFPGGGLEYGEGTRDGLKREFEEEMGLEITVGEHFYTTDFYQPSVFNDAQVISIYYYVHLKEADAPLINLNENERSFWLPIQDLFEDSVTLPIDRVVSRMLHEQRVLSHKEF